MKLLAGAGVALVLAACGQTQQSTATTRATPPAPAVDQAAEAAKARVAQDQANEMIVEKVFAPGTNPQDVVNLLAPDYIQHNPVFVRFAQLNNVQGRDAFKLFIDTLTRLHAGGNPFGPPPGERSPQPPAGNMLYKVMADGDMVTIIHQRYRPDPQHQGKFYEAFSFDTYRVQNGLLAEHWDDATIPAKLPIFLKVPVKDIKFPKQTKHATGA
ncbi:MAG: nuclear transport factor 2 family protein [Steroidobacteraceae bacterium]